MATAIVLGTCGVLLHDPALVKLTDQAGSAGQNTAAGTGTADGSDGSVTTDDWEGTGLAATSLNPSFFAAGACTEFTPGGGPVRDETVFIDAGHGGVDPGGTGQTSSGSTVTESAINLSVALDTMKVLTSAGYRVVLSRTEQTTVLKLGPADTDGGLLSVTGVEQDLAARDICANDAHANLLLGIYMNAGAADEAGSVTLYDDARPFSADSAHFADLLQTDVLARLNGQGYDIPDGGVHTDSGYGSTVSEAGVSYGHLEELGPAYPQNGFTTPSQMPGALIEPLFLTDPFEASIAASGSGQELIASGVANAVEQDLGQSTGS
ncbi:MAG: N-acetylmuramoyl-L-alanine amidase family protein [Trebonia sp.]